MEIEDFREKVGWKTITIITFLLIVFFCAVYGVVMNIITQHSWLDVQCDTNFIKEFRGNRLESAEQARSLLSPGMKIDSINASRMEYCKGYRAFSGDMQYFLCDDGRLYELTNCHKVSKNESMPFLLPNPKNLMGG